MNDTELFMLDYDELHRLFEYKDGHLVRRVARGRIPAGSVAGTINSEGYLLVKIGGKNRRVHRIIFLMLNSYLPDYLDHIDGDKLNNKIENLRECTTSENRFNMTKYKNNKSGVKGVYWCKSTEKWKAAITKNKQTIRLGSFDSISKAKLAVESCRKNAHGEFANNG